MLIKNDFCSRTLKVLLGNLYDTDSHVAETSKHYIHVCNADMFVMARPLFVIELYNIHLLL